MSNTPSDAELDALRQADNGALNFVTLSQFRTIARAVLTKWGTPQPVAREPLLPYQRDTIKTNAWRDTPFQGYYDANAIIDAVEQAHGITQNGGSNVK